MLRQLMMNLGFKVILNEIEKNTTSSLMFRQSTITTAKNSNFSAPVKTSIPYRFGSYLILAAWQIASNPNLPSNPDTIKPLCYYRYTISAHLQRKAVRRLASVLGGAYIQIRPCTYYRSHAPAQPAFISTSTIVLTCKPYIAASSQISEACKRPNTLMYFRIGRLVGCCFETVGSRVPFNLMQMVVP